MCVREREREEEREEKEQDDGNGRKGETKRDKRSLARACTRTTFVEARERKIVLARTNERANDDGDDEEEEEEEENNHASRAICLDGRDGLPRRNSNARTDSLPL